ncbi:hypothetical protein XU18_0249 [Perkinsela sp. CCAP 1560/4]|nr:hypothetical protein XU18_0249 [Perkinsela sp. CCAP 1560/4]|eukprot:KNH09564.1 hypothetical protein XU18_0249 [Perkinsela sp. CCAP 1560/4]
MYPNGQFPHPGSSPFPYDSQMPHRGGPFPPPGQTGGQEPNRRGDFQGNDSRSKFLSPNQCIDRLLTSVTNSSTVARAIEGPSCKYFIVHAENPSEIAYSADFGYWPLRDSELVREIEELYRSDPSTENVSMVLVVFCPSIAKFIGYCYIVSPVQNVSEIDTEGIEMPPSWQSVCKVAWVRVAPLALAALRTQPQYLPQNIDLEILLQSTDGQKIGSMMGENLCTLIDRLSTIRSMSQRDRSVTQSGRALYTLSSSNSERQSRQSMPY